MMTHDLGEAKKLYKPGDPPVTEKRKKDILREWEKVKGSAA